MPRATNQPLRAVVDEREPAWHRHRQGSAWSIEEAERLAASYRGGASVAALALTHGRTTAAIEHRLVEVGLLRPADCQYGGAPRDRRPRESTRNGGHSQPRIHPGTQPRAGRSADAPGSFFRPERHRADVAPQ